MVQVLDSGRKGSSKPKNPADVPYTPEWYARQNAAYAARMNAAAARVPTVVTAPKPAPAPAATYKSSGGSKKAAARPAGGGGGGGGSYADGYNKAVAEANARKTDDSPQLAALRAMLDTGFASARDIKLANIQAMLTSQDKVILDDYFKRAGQLEGSRADNEKSEADASFGNLANRARERGDILVQASSQGAGESDVLRASLAALRNWSANQGDINRSFFDTQRSVNSAIVDLNADTRTSRANLYGSAASDQEQVWANYYNQRADALTQMGNIEANPGSTGFRAASDSFARAAQETAQSWRSPGLPAAVVDWQASTLPQDRTLNNTDAAAAVTNLGAKKKPEGATLRKW